MAASYSWSCIWTEIKQGLSLPILHAVLNYTSHKSCFISYASAQIGKHKKKICQEQLTVDQYQTDLASGVLPAPTMLMPFGNAYQMSDCTITSTGSHLFYFFLGESWCSTNKNILINRQEDNGKERISSREEEGVLRWHGTILHNCNQGALHKSAACQIEDCGGRGGMGQGHRQ